LVSIAHHGVADDVIMQALGDELRRVRDHLGWTRAAVVDRMSSTPKLDHEQGHQHL
jgi:hypothetical protein